MKKVITFPILIFTFFWSYSQPLPEVSFTEINPTGPSLAAITDITGAGDGSGRLFILEKRGTIRILQNNDILDSFFLNIQSLVINSGERGLLGMAFHPSFPDSPYVYVNYVRANADRTNRISRFTLETGDPNELNEGSRRDIIDIPGPQGTNHKAGDIVFGPDGYLYIGTGDGGDGGDPVENGQNIEVLLGKMLRIDINSTNGSTNYVIPPDNPFVGMSGLDQIWMYGLRNPWRISFDRSTSDFWIADVGQGVWEEVNMIPAGTGAGFNLGWDCKEGNHNFEFIPSCSSAVFTDPIFEYPHNCSQGPCPYGTGSSITGGFVYRGNNPLNSSFLGHYVCIDYSSNQVFIIKKNGSTFSFHGHPASGANNITTFGEDDNGEIYAGNLSGDLYLLSFEGTLPLQWEDLLATREANGNKIQWTMYNPFGVHHFEIQRSVTADFANYTSVVVVLPDPDEITYVYHDPYQQPDGVYYRIAAHLQDGSVEYSPVARILPSPLSKPVLTLDINTNLWRLSIPPTSQNGDLLVYDIQGRIVHQNFLAGRAHVDISDPVTPGLYLVTIRAGEDVWSTKIVR